ncbi:MAG TPA: hypothetical protein VFG12_14170 [Rhodopila sp.]|jgi:hypothetical protein|nr:hypothetical protein [Rhodopila sp.]
MRDAAGNATVLLRCGFSPLNQKYVIRRGNITAKTSIADFRQTVAQTTRLRVVFAGETPHLGRHDAGNTLSRHTKMPQIHRFGGFHRNNVGHYGRIVGAVLRRQS